MVSRWSERKTRGPFLPLMCILPSMLGVTAFGADRGESEGLVFAAIRHEVSLENEGITVC